MSERLLRINELLKQKLGAILIGELEWPSGVIVSITDIVTSPDLRHAKVYVSVIPDEKEREAMSILINAAGELQRLLNDAVVLRNIPKLRFFIDKSEQEALEIEQLLDNLK